MGIKWANILMVLLLILGICIFFKALPLMTNLIGTVNAVHGSTDERMFALAVLGVLCITLVGIVKLICNRR